MKAYKAHILNGIAIEIGDIEIARTCIPYNDKLQVRPSEILPIHFSQEEALAQAALYATEDRLVILTSLDITCNNAKSLIKGDSVKATSASIFRRQYQKRTQFKLLETIQI